MKEHTPSRAGSLPRLGWRDGRHDLRGDKINGLACSDQSD